MNPGSSPRHPNPDSYRGWLLIPLLLVLLTACSPTARTPSLESTRAALATAPPPSPTVPALPTGTLPPSPTPSATATPLPTKRILDVPMHRQEHALSCEAAALKMAMGVLGKKVAEEELLARLARDPTPRKLLADGSVQWGDPDVGFVGQWDGVFLKDGYGVYEGPIADLALVYGFQGTTRARGADPQSLYSAVRQGFPAIVWVPYGLEVRGRGAWTTPTGKRIDYVVTEHAVVLAGIDGEGVYYADPLKPDLQRAPYRKFEAALAELGSRAVVLRPRP